jgi:acetyl-CoA carboxylase biotin carboxyl carrier protein
MRESKIRKLIKLVEESDIDELEVTSWGRRVKITKKVNHSGEMQSAHLVSVPVQRAGVQAKVSEKVEAPAPPTPQEEIPENLVPIKSPMVGTFYRTPAPGTKSYVELNQAISVGQVVCIVEAMKLMNEIESEVVGRVVKILVENAQPVEFGQVLFLIEPL